MRNDGTLRARGLQHLHVEPITPREYVEEPFYHLELLISDKEQRRRKVVRYEVARPHLLAPGGGRINEAFYLPELHDSLKTIQVPEEDRAKIANEATDNQPDDGAADVEIASAIADVPFVSLKEMDRLWEGRTVRQDAYRATIEPRERTSSMTPSEQRHIFFYVSNEGTEHWPSGAGSEPPVRLSYRWLHPDESVHTAEGPRSPFPRAVNPGERILMPLHVDAPPSNGDYILEVDIVHEHVRWFGCNCRVPVHVGAPAGLPTTGPGCARHSLLVYAACGACVYLGLFIEFGSVMNRCQQSRNTSAKPSRVITHNGRCVFGQTRTLRSWT